MSRGTGRIVVTGTVCVFWATPLSVGSSGASYNVQQLPELLSALWGLLSTQGSGESRQNKNVTKPPFLSLLQGHSFRPGSVRGQARQSLTVFIYCCLVIKWAPEKVFSPLPPKVHPRVHDLTVFVWFMPRALAACTRNQFGCSHSWGSKPFPGSLMWLCSCSNFWPSSIIQQSGLTPFSLHPFSLKNWGFILPISIHSCMAILSGVLPPKLMVYSLRWTVNATSNRSSVSHC